MPEPIAGATPAAQPGDGQQPAAQQTQEGQQPNPATAGQQPAAAAQPSVEELTRQLAEVRKQAEVASQSARHFQSLADKEAARVRAMSGLETPVDPLAPHIKALAAKGYSEEDARNLLSVVDAMNAPIARENAQLRASFGATTLIDSAMQQAYAAEPELFANPEIAQAVRGELSRAAMAPNGAAYVNPQYAVEFAAAEWAQRNKPWKQAAQQQPTPQVHQAPNMAFLGQPGGFRPAVAAQQQPNPQAEALYQKMAEYSGLPKKP